MTSVIVVAAIIIDECDRMNMPLTPQKLMKLCYIAHGCHLAIGGEPLFDDRIEAWRYGPIIPALYKLIRNRNGINYIRNLRIK